MTLEKIQNTSPKLPELVMQALISAMGRGSLQVGDELPSERDLSETLGIGRGSLRECLAVLEFLGAIETRGNRKALIRDADYIRNAIYFVRVSNREDIQEDFLEFRRINESAIAELASQRATEEDLASLERCLQRMAEHPEDPMTDVNFHVALALASHNALLASASHLVNSMIAGIRDRFFERPDYPQIAYESHVLIYNAVRDRDPERARTEIENHLQIVRKFSQEYPEQD